MLARATYRRLICALHTVLVLLLGPLALIFRLKVRLHLTVRREVPLTLSKRDVSGIVLLRLLIVIGDGFVRLSFSLSGTGIRSSTVSQFAVLCGLFVSNSGFILHFCNITRDIFGSETVSRISVRNPFGNGFFAFYGAR